LFGVLAHLRIALGGGQGFGLGDLIAELAEFEVGGDEPGQAAVFLGDLGITGPVGDHGRVGELLFEFAVTGQGLLEILPHGSGTSSRVTKGSRRTMDPGIGLRRLEEAHGISPEACPARRAAGGQAESIAWLLRRSRRPSCGWPSCTCAGTSRPGRWYRR